MHTINIRKETAGSTSSGYVWETDGAVLALPAEDAHDLLTIQDGGFTEVPEAVAANAPVPAPAGGQEPPAAPAAGEGTPDAASADSAPPAKPSRRRRTAAPKE